MLKNSIYFTLVIILTNCNPKDCFESTGKIVQQEVVLEVFTKILVSNEISLILKQGEEQNVIIETGENLLNEISASVIGDQLIVEDNNGCNFSREYALTRIIVTSPNITEIRANTSRSIKSDGILEYPNLLLLSENFNSDFLSIADFDLTINNQSLRVSANGNSVFKINGVTENLTIGFFAGSSRFEGQDLIANTVAVTQKSSNDMLVNPIQKIEGTIFSTGDVISFNQPDIINVEALYTGELIFN